MRESMTYLVRGLSLAALLMAGSCAVPGDGVVSGLSLDGAANNPIRVEPSYQALKLTYWPGQGMAAADAPRFTAFVEDYRNHGNGSIIVSVPAGVSANEATIWFGDHINAMGISRDHILVTTHEVPLGNGQVELNYVSYTASTNPCGNWSQDLSKNWDNNTPQNFGCAVQQNIAAMVSDPRDLLGPGPMDDADARRRATVIDKYDAGQPTPAEKSSDQSGTISDVAK